MLLSVLGDLYSAMCLHSEHAAPPQLLPGKPWIFLPPPLPWFQRVLIDSPPIHSLEFSSHLPENVLFLPWQHYASLSASLTLSCLHLTLHFLLQERKGLVSYLQVLLSNRAYRPKKIYDGWAWGHMSLIPKALKGGGSLEVQGQSDLHRKFKGS